MISHIDDLDLSPDFLPQFVGDVGAQRLHVVAVGVLRRQRIKIGEHLMEGGPQLPRDEVVANILEVAVVQEQFVGGRRLDAPAHAVLDVCRRVVAQLSI
jgi:hypothetical protein